jgi:hypothetical protein
MDFQLKFFVFVSIWPVYPCRARLCLATPDCYETLRGTSLIHTEGFPAQIFGFRVDLARLPVSGPFMTNDVGLSRNFTWDFTNTHGWISNSKCMLSCRFRPWAVSGPFMSKKRNASLKDGQLLCTWHFYNMKRDVDGFGLIWPVSSPWPGYGRTRSYISTCASLTDTKLGVGSDQQENDWHR